MGKWKKIKEFVKHYRADAKEEAPSAVLVDTSQSDHARLKPVPLDAVTLTDSFWQPKRETLKEVTLKDQYEKCEETGRIDNFRRAAGKIDKEFQGRYYNDSDVYKWLEAVCWMLAEGPDETLEEMANTVIDEIVDAQDEDGYINTHFSVDKENERWSNIKDMHELYCGGHLIQAGIAHYRVTGSTRLLDVGKRFADLIADVFGEDKLHAAPGHEEIELALVELSRVTGEEKYLDLAKYFIDARGQSTIGGNAYHQDHMPFREMRTIEGHAVRAVYLVMGATDLFSDTGEEELMTALDALWTNMTGKRMYVTGGIGARYTGESFGSDYDLPNEMAYAETCAAIANVMWNWRMLLLEGDAKYADIMELALYNGALVGLSQSGDEYFYVNPLADNNTKRRQEWFGCACCPPNIARMLAEIPGQLYSTSEEGIWAHLFADSTAEIDLDGRIVRLVQETDYPWDGSVRFTVDGEGEFSLYLRVPGWSEGASIEVAGETIDGLVPREYAEVRREWNKGDTVSLELPMPVQKIESHPYIIENQNKQALMCGPIVYCLESVDNFDTDLRDVVFYSIGGFEAKYDPDILGGVNVLCGPMGIFQEDDWEEKPYRKSRFGPIIRNRTITAIPYYAWANREPGQMIVWLRT